MYLSEGFGPSSLFKKKDGSCITITRARRAPRTSEGQARQGSQTVDARRGRDNMLGDFTTNPPVAWISREILTDRV